MAESSQEGCPAKSVRGKELAKASGVPHANCRHPRHRIGKKNSSRA